MPKNVIDLLVTAVTSGGWFEITIPSGTGTYISRRISFAVLSDAFNADTQVNKGYFATEAALNAEYPVGENGWYAIVGATDTVWLWDDDTPGWVDSGQNGAVVSVNGMTGVITLTATDIPFSSLQGLAATNVRDGIDELKIYVEGLVSGAGGIYVADYRSGEETVTTGSNTITFKNESGVPSRMIDDDYDVIIDDVSGCGVDKLGITQSASGFDVDVLSNGTIKYMAIRYPSTLTPLTGSDNFTSTFDNSSLVSGVLTISLPEEATMVTVTVYNDSNVKEDLSGMLDISGLPDDVSIDFGGSITGTWTYFVEYWT